MCSLYGTNDESTAGLPSLFPIEAHPFSGSLFSVASSILISDNRIPKSWSMYHRISTLTIPHLESKHLITTELRVDCSNLSSNFDDLYHIIIIMTKVTLCVVSYPDPTPGWGLGTRLVETSLQLRSRSELTRRSYYSAEWAT